MKKSIAVILLGSALLLPNNNIAEASYKDANVQGENSPYVQCIKWEGHQFHGKHIQLNKQSYYNFYTMLEKYFGVVKPAPSKPIVTPDKKPTPVPEDTPKPDVTPVPDVKPTPEVTPKPEVTPVPDVKPTPEVKPEPEVTPVPDVVPTPTPVEPTPEKPSKPVEDTNNSSISAIEQAVLNLTNVERQKAGLAPLQVDSKLMDSARAKSKDMSSKNYFSHTSPTYGSPFDQMKAFGISYRSAAENIAMGQRSAEEVVKAWMESPGHRQNILGSSYTHIGIGYDTNGHYWTQQFIGK